MLKKTFSVITTILAVVLFAMLGTAAFALDFHNERTYGNGLTDFYWEFQPFSADTASYKEYWQPRIDNQGCKDATIEMYELLPVSYEQRACKPTYKEVCEDALIKGDAKNGTADNTIRQCHNIIDGETCENTIVTIFEKYDLTKNDLLFSKDATLVVHATRKPKTGFQACDLNFVYDNQYTRLDTASAGKTWWNITYAQRLPINCSLAPQGMPFLINGSSGFTIAGQQQLVWTVCNGTGTSIYLRNSSDYSQYVIANDTTALPFDVELGNASSYNPTQVWSGYKQVYHMGDHNTTQVNDSTANALKGTKKAANTPLGTNTGCVVGNCQRYNSTSYITLGTNMLDNLWNVTISMWLNNTQTAELWLWSGAWSSPYSLYIDLQADKKFKIDEGSLAISSGTYAASGAVNYYTFMKTNTTWSIYENGTYKETLTHATWTQMPVDSQSFILGTNTNSVTGIIDEYRLFPEYKTNATITAEFNNFKNTAGYGNVGVAENNMFTTQLSAGLLVDGSRRANQTVLSGEEFRFFTNWSWQDNSSAVTSSTGSCSYFAQNVSNEHASQTGLNKTVCGNPSCDYNPTTTVALTGLATQGYIYDVLHVALCRFGSVGSTATISTNCSATTQTLTDGDLPLCGSGYVNYTIKNTWCANKTSMLVNVTQTGSASSRLNHVDQLVYVDRFRNDSDVMDYWSNLSLWVSPDEHEHYSAGNRTASFNCTANSSSTQNQTASLNYAAMYSSPSAFFISVSDWIFGEQALTNGASVVTKYPLLGVVNVTAQCSSPAVDLANSYVNLSNSTGGLVRVLAFSAPGMTWQLGMSNFSGHVNEVFGLSMRCLDTGGLVSYANANINVSNLAPSAFWLNASGGLYGSLPVLAYTCWDPENNDGGLGNNLASRVFVNSSFNASSAGMFGGNVTQYFSASGWGEGSYDVGVDCWDSMVNGTQSNLVFTYSAFCLLDVFGIREGGRYIDVLLPVTMNCSNGRVIGSCSYSINGFESSSVVNCSGFNLSLEVGSNDVVINVTDVVGVEASKEFRVFAKSRVSSGFGAYVVLVVLCLACVLLFWVYRLSGSVVVFGLLACFGVFLVGYYLVAFSLWAAVLVWLCGVVLFFWIMFS